MQIFIHHCQSGMEIRLRNFECHTDRLIVLDYQEDPTRILLHGDSGVGKSTLLRAIDHCLYGRRLHKEDRKDTWVQISTEIFGAPLRIRRQRNPGRLQVTFDETDYEGEAAQAIIETHFPSADIFAACCYIKQGQRCGLLSAKPEDQVKYLTQLAFEDEDPDALISVVSDERKRVSKEFETKSAAYNSAVETFNQLADVEIFEVTQEEIDARAKELKETEVLVTVMRKQLAQNQKNQGKKETLEKALKQLKVPDPVSEDDLSDLAESLKRLRIEQDHFTNRSRLEKELTAVKLPAAVSEEDVAKSEAELKQLRVDLTGFKQRSKLLADLAKTGDLLTKEPVNRTKEESARLRKLAFDYDRSLKICQEYDVEFLPEEVQNIITESKENLEKHRKFQAWSLENQKVQKLRAALKSESLSAVQLEQAEQTRLLQLAKAYQVWNDLFTKAEVVKKKLRHSSRSEVEDLIQSKRREIEDFKKEIGIVKKQQEEFQEWSEASQKLEDVRKKLKHESREEVLKLLSQKRDTQRVIEAKKVLLQSAAGDLECPCCQAVLALVNGKLETAEKKPDPADLKKLESELAVIRKDLVALQAEADQWVRYEQLNDQLPAKPAEVDPGRVSELETELTNTQKLLPGLQVETDQWVRYEQLVDQLPEKPPQVELTAEEYQARLEDLRKDIMNWEVFQKVSKSLGPQPEEFELEDSAVELIEKAITDLSSLKFAEKPRVTAEEIDSDQRQRSIWEKQRGLLVDLSEYPEVEDPSSKIPIVEKSLEKLRKDSREYLAAKTLKDNLVAKLQKIPITLDVSAEIDTMTKEYRRLEVQKSDYLVASQKLVDLTADLAKLEFFDVSVEESQKLERTVQRTRKWLADAEQSLKIFQVQARLDRDADELDQLAIRNKDLQKLYQVMFDMKYTIIESTLVSLTTTTNEILEKFFREPIEIQLDMFKKAKTTEALRRGFNIVVNFRGRETSIADLSGGEGDRVSLALSLALASLFNAPLVLVDESIGSLDTELKTQCLEAIKEIPALGIVLIVAHDYNEADFDSSVELEGIPDLT